MNMFDGHKHCTERWFVALRLVVCSLFGVAAIGACTSGSARSRENQSDATQGAALDGGATSVDGSDSEGERDGATQAPTQDSGGMDAPAPNAHCAPTANWDPSYTKLEEAALVIVNEARAQGRSCGSFGMFAPTAPLTMEPRLRCAARLHSKYMGETKDYGHVTRDGVSYEMRIQAAGYEGLVSENIAAGARSAEEVMDLWLSSAGHCRNIMDPQLTEIGIGYATDNVDDGYFGPYPYWTQTFGRPQGQ